MSAQLRNRSLAPTHEEGGLYFASAGHVIPGWPVVFFAWTDASGAVRDVSLGKFVPEDPGEYDFVIPDVIESYFRACKGRAGQSPITPAFIEAGCIEADAFIDVHLWSAVRERGLEIPSSRAAYWNGPLVQGQDLFDAMIEAAERAGVAVPENLDPASLGDIRLGFDDLATATPFALGGRSLAEGFAEIDAWVHGAAESSGSRQIIGDASSDTSSFWNEDADMMWPKPGGLYLSYKHINAPGYSGPIFVWMDHRGIPSDVLSGASDWIPERVMAGENAYAIDHIDAYSDVMHDAIAAGRATESFLRGCHLEDGPIWPEFIRANGKAAQALVRETILPELEGHPAREGRPLPRLLTEGECPSQMFWEPLIFAEMERTERLDTAALKEWKHEMGLEVMELGGVEAALARTYAFSDLPPNIDTTPRWNTPDLSLTEPVSKRPTKTKVQRVRRKKTRQERNRAKAKRKRGK